MRAGDVVADVEVERDVVADVHQRVELFDRRDVVRVIVERDVDLVLLGERRELLGQLVVALGGDRLAAEGLGDLEVEVDVVVGLAEGDLVDVDVDAGVVVHLAKLLALGQLRLAHLGSVGIDRRRRGIVALSPFLPRPARAGRPA